MVGGKRRGRRQKGGPGDDSMRSREEHLDEYVPIVTAVVQQTERTADAADAHMRLSRVQLRK